MKKLTRYQELLVKHITGTGQKIQLTSQGQAYLIDGTQIPARTFVSLLHKGAISCCHVDLTGEPAAFEIVQEAA